jgi:uncharacterized protein
VPKFAVTYSYGPEAADRRAELLPEHRAWLKTIDDEGRVLGAGIFPDKSGALLVFEAESLDAIQRDLEADPFARAGAIVKTDIKEWAPNWGVLSRSISEGMAR